MEKKEENLITRIVRNWEIFTQMQAVEVLWKELIDPCIVTGTDKRGFGQHRDELSKTSSPNLVSYSFKQKGENDYLGDSSRSHCKKEVAEILRVKKSLKGGDEMESKINTKIRASNSGKAGLDSFSTPEILSHMKRQLLFFGSHQELKQQCRHPHGQQESYTKQEVSRESAILVFTSAGTDKLKLCICLLLILFPASSLHGPAL